MALLKGLLNAAKRFTAILREPNFDCTFLMHGSKKSLMMALWRSSLKGLGVCLPMEKLVRPYVLIN
ncbi:hypothetical protein U1Q18_002567, partial [Sarracenia purpurea var. burkii]